MREIAEGTRSHVRQARRAWLGAAFNHAWALHLQVWAWPVPPGVLEEIEIKARLEHAAYDELRKLSTSRTVDRPEGTR